MTKADVRWLTPLVWSHVSHTALLTWTWGLGSTSMGGRWRERADVRKANSKAPLPAGTGTMHT